VEGAKLICSPPLREESDQEALWHALANGDLQVISSDHAPYAMDKTGKLANGSNPNFKQVANGMPGLEWRLPLVFDAMVSKGRYEANSFVAWTATNPAKIYGLHPKKGSIAIGADADIAVWDPTKKVTLNDAAVHDRTRYNPWFGRTIQGWPVSVLRRGNVIVEEGSLKAKAGSGKFLPREAGWAAKPLGRTAPEFDPAWNFGAQVR
jgi:dihydropyrimidinase